MKKYTQSKHQSKKSANQKTIKRQKPFLRKNGKLHVEKPRRQKTDVAVVFLFVFPVCISQWKEEAGRRKGGGVTTMTVAMFVSSCQLLGVFLIYCGESLHYYR
mmetsp:Transcript_26462/g.41464  ORF Transcript_26462/g.41464 Transcript_26462/m.41464 type:complete len:103 (+) Transcript_26462:253-561(+)